MALDVIREVGPGGYYLGERHTLNHHRNELWRPMISNRDNMDIWKEKGSKSYEELLIEEAIRILETHEPEPLPDDIAHRINEIADRADKALAKVEFVA